MRVYTIKFILNSYSNFCSNYFTGGRESGTAVQTPGHELVNQLLNRPFPAVRHRMSNENPNFEPIPAGELTVVFWHDGLTVLPLL